MKTKQIFVVLLLGCFGFLFDSCKQTTTAVQFPAQIDQISYDIFPGFHEYAGLTIKSDSVKFSWGKLLPPNGVFVVKKVGFKDSTLLSMLRGVITTEEFWNLSGTYGGDSTIADMAFASIAIVADATQSKEVVVWDNAAPPKNFSKLSCVLDSIVDSYKIQFPIQ